MLTRCKYTKDYLYRKYQVGVSSLTKCRQSLCACVTLYKTFFFVSRNTQLLNVSSCSAEQKMILYELSNSSFSTYRNSFSDFYTLIKAYLGRNTQNWIEIFLYEPLVSRWNLLFVVTSDRWSSSGWHQRTVNTEHQHGYWHI